MPYVPNTPPLNIEDLQRYVELELNRINDDIVALGNDQFQFSILYAEPTKYSEGMVVFADGIHWNPNSGRGLYERVPDGWQKLSQGEYLEVILPPDSLDPTSVCLKIGGVAGVCVVDEGASSGFDAESLKSDGSVASSEQAMGIWWRDDGLVFYTANFTASDQMNLFEHTVSNRYDIGSQTGVSSAFPLPLTTNINAGRVFWFSQDGTRIIVLFNSNLAQYSLPAYDLSNITFDKTNFGALPVVTLVYSVTSDGSHLYIVNPAGLANDIYQFRIGEDGNVDSIVGAGVFDYNSIYPSSGNSVGVAVSSDGLKLFLSFTETDDVQHFFENDLAGAFDISSMTQVFDSDALPFNDEITVMGWSPSGGFLYESIAFNTYATNQYTSLKVGTGGIASKLHHDNVERLTTTGDGVKVTDNITFSESETVFPADHDDHIADNSIHGKYYEQSATPSDGEDVDGSTWYDNTL